jgi:subtilisin family serine protease
MRRNGSSGTMRPTTVIPSGVDGCADSASKHRAAQMLAVASVILAAAAILAGSATAHRHAAPAPVSARIEVVYTAHLALDRALQHRDARIVRLVAPIRSAEIETRHPGSLIKALRVSPGIVSVRRVVSRSVMAEGASIGAATAGLTAWASTATDLAGVPATVLAEARNVTIAVVDTGADVGSPDLSGRIAATYDIGTGTRSVVDPSGHGTFVASLAGGSPTVGGTGGQARLLIVKVAESSSMTDVDVAAGIVFAVRHGARIVNLSVAGRTPSPVEQGAVAYAAQRGVLLVAAAGNDALAGDPVEYPAAYIQPVGSSGVGGTGLVVGASDQGGSRAPFSEFGSFISLAAPGVSVVGAVSRQSSPVSFPRASFDGLPPGALYGYGSGTSFAAPQAAGAAALVWAANPSLSARAVAAILKSTASGHGLWTPTLGFGVIDIAAAVDRAADTQLR